MAETLAVKYRPKTFSDCVHQGSIISILERQISTNSIKNCYLFCGASGCGKTTLARIFSCKINGGVDTTIEIDAASNNSVDNVRNIIDDAKNMPISSKYKVYVLDECHMLSNSAWNAFLKCIEEPPEHSVFIFCTTDPQKIPPTILNRVMRFNLSRIPSDLIVSRLKYICDSENFTNYDECIEYISKTCNGSLRTAISMLDKVSSYSNNLGIENAKNVLGDYSTRTMLGLVWYMLKQDSKKIILQIESLYDEGNDLKVFMSQFLDVVLDLAKYSIFNDISVTKFTSSDEPALKGTFTFKNNVDIFTKYMEALRELNNSIKFEINPKSSIEVGLISISRLEVAQ